MNNSPEGFSPEEICSLIPGWKEVYPDLQDGGPAVDDKLIHQYIDGGPDLAPEAKVLIGQWRAWWNRFLILSVELNGDERNSDG